MAVFRIRGRHSDPREVDPDTCNWQAVLFCSRGLTKHEDEIVEGEWFSRLYDIRFYDYEDLSHDPEEGLAENGPLGRANVRLRRKVSSRVWRVSVSEGLGFESIKRIDEGEKETLESPV